MLLKTVLAVMPPIVEVFKKERPDKKNFWKNVEAFEELKVLLEEAINERIASGKNDEMTL